MKNLKLPVSIEDFQEIRNSEFYYIDKTGLIEQLLDNWGKVNLFTRPRRFGKILNMSMLRYFFEIGTDRNLFDGLYISHNKKNYWSQTSTFESIRPFINMDFDGLRAAIIEMLSGDAVPVNSLTFQNDMVNLKCRDDVVTLLIHLGYLAYNSGKKIAFIPNEEVRQEFVYVPKLEYVTSYPALVVELKWKKSVQTAIQQIREKKYPESLLQYTGDILIVGINYDKDSKKHECLIEQYEKE